MGTKKYETSISYKYYWESLNNFENFISYNAQLKEIYTLNPKNVLEVGVGNKLVYNHLKAIGVTVTSLDINPKLKPDYIGDIRELPFNNNSFDIICAFEVLEHLPFSDFEKCLRELQRVSSKNVIISIPIRKVGIEFYMWLPKIHEIYFYVDLPIPVKHEGVISDKEDHYWETNKIGFPKTKIINMIKKYFRIKKEFRPKFNKYHWFLVLEKI